MQSQGGKHLRNPPFPSCVASVVLMTPLVLDNLFFYAPNAAHFPWSRIKLFIRKSTTLMYLMGSKNTTMDAF